MTETFFFCAKHGSFSSSHRVLGGHNWVALVTDDCRVIVENVCVVENVWRLCASQDAVSEEFHCPLPFRYAIEGKLLKCQLNLPSRFARSIVEHLSCAVLINWLIVAFPFPLPSSFILIFISCESMCNNWCLFLYSPLVTLIFIVSIKRLFVTGTKTQQKSQSHMETSCVDMWCKIESLRIASMSFSWNLVSLFISSNYQKLAGFHYHTVVPCEFFRCLEKWRG